MTRVVRAACAALAVVATLGVSSALAQTQNPLVLQPIHNPVVFAPDVKITDVAHTTGVLVGGYAGVNMDETLLIGGAGYWLVNPYNQVHMGYGGFLIGWRVLKSGSMSLAVRDLVGGGSATLYQPYAGGLPPYPMPVQRHGPSYSYPYGYYGYWTNFFVTEPEARAQFALGTAVSIDAGVGYRVTSAGYGWGSQLNGVTGSIALRFNFGQ